MKKIHFLTIAMLAVVLGACQVREAEPDQTSDSREAVLTAVIESSATRTSLSPAENGLYHVFWSDGDRIGIFTDGSAEPVPFSLKEGAGTRNGLFTGSRSGRDNTGVYPWDEHLTLDGTVLRMTLPAEQQWVEGGFAEGLYPMAAVSPSADLSFKGLASILKVSLTGHQFVTRLVFRPRDPSARVAGPACFSLADPDAPVFSPGEGGVDSLVLQVGSVRLDPEKATDFLLVLPPQTYRGGFNVRIHTTTGYMDKSYDRDFTMQRAQIHPASPITVELSSGVDISPRLEGDGTADSPFLISSVGDLLLMRQFVNLPEGTLWNSGNEPVPAAGACYLLTADLDLAPVCSRESGVSWIPIGTEGTPFTGSFEGGGHAVSHLYIHSPEASDVGLFGVLWDGSRVSAVSVEGEVTGKDHVGLLAGLSRGVLASCKSAGKVVGGTCVAGLCGLARKLTVGTNEAEVTGGNSVGGLVGYCDYSFIWENNFEKCLNTGRIRGVSDVGGVIGYSMGNLVDCINRGDVLSEDGEHTGGIMGRMVGGLAINGRNEGNVSGNACVGGIAGTARSSARICNCVNCATVRASTGFLGGICGDASNLYSYSGPTSLLNCVNTGPLFADGTDVIRGGIAGQSAGEQEESSASRAEQCYWLFDAGKGLGCPAGIGSDAGSSARLFPLTDLQMKGAAVDVVCYRDASGTVFSTVVEALNAWAYDNRSAMTLQGWQASGGEGYPTLSGFEVQPPGVGQDVFSVSPDYFDMPCDGGTIVVTISAAMDYTVEMPDWIEIIAVHYDDVSPCIKDYSFKVSPNGTGGSRSGEIRITNSSGTVRLVSVTQKKSYMNVDIPDMSFPAAEGARLISIYANTSWEVLGGEDWFTVTPRSGRGDGALTVKVFENMQPSARSASFRIVSTDGSVSYPVSVLQSGSTSGTGGDWKTRSLIHQSLLMDFTATWCGYCPRMHRNIISAQSQIPGKLQYVTIHGPGSALAFASADPLISQYKIDNYPTGILEGSRYVGNYNDPQSVVSSILYIINETERRYGTRTGVEIGTSVSGRTVTIDVNAYIKKAGQYKVNVLLMENGVVCDQADNDANGYISYTHDRVARIAVSDVRGDAFSVSEDLTVKPFHYSVDVPSSYILDNLFVLVYIQRAFGSDPVYQTMDYGDYFVDNCGVVKLGRHLDLAVEGGTAGNDNEGLTPGDDINLD